MQVRIEKTSAIPPYRGEVTIGNLKRSVDGARCEEVVRALALVSNMILDAEVEATSTPIAAPERNDEPAVVTPSPALLASKPRLATAFWLHAGGAYDGERAMPTFSIGALRMLIPRVPIFMGLEFAFRFAQAEASVYRARLFWITARYQWCAFPIGRHALRLGGCAMVEAGVNHAEAEGALDATARDRFWVSVGPSIQAYWVPERGNSVFVGLRANALFPLTRDRFVLAGGPVLFATSNVVPELGVSVGYLIQ